MYMRCHNSPMHFDAQLAMLLIRRYHFLPLGDDKMHNFAMLLFYLASRFKYGSRQYYESKVLHSTEVIFSIRPGVV